jgi:Domain of unknown function (DUF4129)
MAVSALELRPRGAIALFDAAIRICATSTGVWALTLPSGAALIAALFNLADAISRRQPLALPVCWWTLAWVFRAISQGAACHHVEQQILAPNEPSVRASFLAALKRAPGLITAAATLAVINGAIWLFSAGIGFLFLGAHAAGYAAIMRGEGSALNVYGTSAKLLGPTRSIATWVRLCGITQVFLAFNLHLAAVAALYLARSVLGFDVAFVDRFVSFDNGVWVATVLVTTFALFEPLRAATGTLLLIDGRVRQEGLDLLAAVEQLPHRRKKLAPLVASGALLLALCWPSVSHAADPLVGRLQRLVSSCKMESVTSHSLERLEGVDERDRSSLGRFVARLERTAYDDEDCESAEADLREGVALIPLEAASEPGNDDPQALARALLARPEFQQAPEPEVEAKAEESAISGWWDALMRALWDWLKHLSERQRDPAPDLGNGGSTEMIGANVVMVVAIVVVAVVLVMLLLRSRPKPDASDDEAGQAVTESALSDDPASALSRPAESWAGLADELAAKGEFREAIRHLYLALLARLHRDGVIDYDPTNSNWDYLLAFKGAAEVRGAFRDLTRRFDFAWYGNFDVTNVSWRAFRSTAEPLLAPTSEPPRA